MYRRQTKKLELSLQRVGFMENGRSGILRKLVGTSLEHFDDFHGVPPEEFTAGQGASPSDLKKNKIPVSDRLGYLGNRRRPEDLPGLASDIDHIDSLIDPGGTESAPFHKIENMSGDNRHSVPERPV